jgi:hypothetical protein
VDGRMKHSIIFIEGLPGSGKSTYAQKLHQHLLSKGVACEVFTEGELHPIDLAWCSVMDKQTYERMLKEFAQYADQIKQHTRQQGNRYTTAYTKVKVEDPDVSFFEKFGAYEIYKTNDFPGFKNTHLDLWKSFHPAGKVYLFECVFLQNHINELILKFDASRTDIVSYFQGLISCVSQYDPLLIYINQVDIQSTLDAVIEQRRSDNPAHKDWIELVYEYLQSTTHGKQKGFTGYNGVLSYFSYRRDLELEIIASLPIETKVFDLDGDYDTVFEQIVAVT